MLVAIRGMTKQILLFTFTILLLNCNATKNTPDKKLGVQMNFTNITNLINYSEFNKIKKFVLKNGDKKTYRNFDNNNPHFKFENFDTFLSADIGQRNINNDPEVSDFNQLTILDWNSDIQYYDLVLVRKGDLEENKNGIREGMKEEQVYLVDVYSRGLVVMVNELTNYLEEIRKEIKATNRTYN